MRYGNILIKKNIGHQKSGKIGVRPIANFNWRSRENQISASMSLITQFLSGQRRLINR